MATEDGFDDDRDRAIVEERDLHMGPELSGGYANVMGSDLIYNSVHERIRHFRVGGANEGRPAALPDISEQGELADDQHPATDVAHRAVQVTLSSGSGETGSGTPEP